MSCAASDRSISRIVNCGKQHAVAQLVAISACVSAGRHIRVSAMQWQVANAGSLL